MIVSESILTEVRFFLISVLSGAALIFFYDIFRILRRVIVHGAIWIAIEDFFYWLSCAILFFAMLYQENDGLVRGFAMGGLFLGMFCYNRFVSPYVIKYAALLLGFLMKILRKLCGILIKPLKKAKKILKKIGKAVKIGLCKL
ncbi:MAG: spore cortex biosynthesis protein YabQ [Lachnospiraceae bacterium]|nr:spore cortex biosynthesis protein YabQ [Lachnospiraceae bacterium]